MPKLARDSNAMSVVAVLRVLADLCQHDQIVVTNQGSARIWPKVRRRLLDFHYNPSTMGGAIPLALGLALSQPKREVLVVSGDGSLLMSLGSLVTVVGSGATNLTIVLLDNGIYEVTGGQATAAAHAGVDFADLARSVGFPSVAAYREQGEWESRASGIFALPGPRFIELTVGPAPSEYLSSVTPPMNQQLAGLQHALGSESLVK